MERDELGAWLRLSLTAGIGNLTARKLLAEFGLPQEVFARSAEQLMQVSTSRQAQALATPPANLEDQLAKTLAWLKDQQGTGKHILTLADRRYPPALLETEDPPLLLYVQGALPATWPDGVAIVGSRNPTPQGAGNARQFARSLAQAGLTVVSGLALGIDAAAHEGALEGAAPDQVATIAVVGTGLDRVYPSQHLQLAHRIADRGLILSEYALGTGPLAENFPRRNRIISALGLGTLVVEAAMRSGSLITARMAVEQGREVFAIPGSIHSPQARGCHWLIRQGAKLVETAQDVLDELRTDNAARCIPESPPAATGHASDEVLTALGFEPSGLDALIARTGLPASLLQARLLELELQGAVARLPGGLFQRVTST